MATAGLAARAEIEPNPDQADPEVEEVRVALALNGGVSLAVWMGGCAVELDRARRTRRGGQSREAPLYQALCDSFRRELVLDVMSGSSAGGINGALLAGAMAHGRALTPDFLRSRWLELGDFSKLLQPLKEPEPTALLRGDYFEDELANTFDQLIRREPGGAPTLTPALDVTTTDIEGRTKSFRDTWGGMLHATEHRARFEFRRKEDFSPEKLAAAARASASFPIAFEPFQPTGAAELAQIDGHAYVVDGGLLDNAPIRAALDLIPSRAAHRQVRRLLCYVNGDPAAAPEPALPDAEPPTPRGVVGTVLNLPRKAPFADQLEAVQDAARNAGIAGAAEHELLTVDLDSLRATATALLPTYRRRRRLKALQDAAVDPADVQVAFVRLDEDEDLPWLRGTLDPDRGAWPWGLDAARRVHELVLDVVRGVLPQASKEDREAILRERTAIDARLEALRQAREDTEGMTAAAVAELARGTPVSEALNELGEQLDADAGAIAADLEATARSLVSVLRRADKEDRGSLGPAFFGVAIEAQTELTSEMLDAFLRRVVAVEVVRRSFTADDSLHNPQNVSFGQLTPAAPDPIFTDRPFTEDPPRAPSVSGKLCGAILGHFGGFYRRSWRANDFLWGRMDAAARIVEMLVGSQRSRDLAATDGHQAWTVLADALAAAGPQQRELLEEALDDLEPQTKGQELKPRLEEVLRKDLTEAPKEVMGRNTRVICTRAAQFEVLRDELPHLVAAAESDFELGCTPATLGLQDLELDTDANVLEAVRRLRRTGCVLPEALGRDSRAELTSDLAARTIARAGLVGLGVSQAVGGKPATPLRALRSALLPVSGTVSLERRHRLAVAAAFSAAALYLGARLAATNDAPRVRAGDLSLHELLMTVVALLVIAGTIALPGLRAWAIPGRRRWLWIGTAAALAAVSGVLSALLATVVGPLRWHHLLIAPGTDPPLWVIALPIALGTGLVVVKPLRRFLEGFAKAPWLGTPSLVLVFAAAIAVAVWAVPELVGALDGEWWQLVAAALALAAAPVALVTVEMLPRYLARRSRAAALRDARAALAAGDGAPARG